MSRIDFFSMEWTVGASTFSFDSDPLDPTLLLPDGRQVALSVEAWIALREVLGLLPTESDGRVPALGVATAVRGPATRSPANGLPRRGKAWTPTEEGQLREAWAQSADAARIAEALGRSKGAVLARLVQLGLLTAEAANLRFPPTFRAASEGAAPRTGP